MEKTPAVVPKLNLDFEQTSELGSVKQTLRQAMTARMLAWPPEAKREESNIVIDLIQATVAWKAAQLVLLYAALPMELSVDNLFEAALAAGKTVAFPRVTQAELSFKQLASPLGPWQRGPFGIKEPPAELPAVDFYRASGPILIITPGLAFDRNGGRLGRGKGYYDRFLARLRQLRPDSQALGVAFSFQLIAKVPMGQNDQALDAVATAKGGVLLSRADIDMF